MRDWDLIRFGIFGDSIRSAGFDSRILAVASTVEALLLRLEMLR